MKTKHLFLAIVLTCMCMPARGTIYTGVCGENVTWSLDSETKVLTISGEGEMYHEGHFSDTLHWQGNKLYSSIRSVVVEPGVTNVGYWAFANCENLTSVSLPDGITVVEEDAFYNTGLTSIVLPNTVQRVEKAAFSDCKSLQSCDLGRGVKYIGEATFYNCYVLEHLRWSDCLETIDGCIFWNLSSQAGVGELPIPLCDTLYFPPTFRSMKCICVSNMPNVPVAVWNARHPDNPSGVSSPLNIGVGYGYSFKKIIVGADVEYIPNYLFYGYLGDTLLLPEGVTHIGKNAFQGCKNLRYVNFPDAVRYIGKEAFKGCKALTQLALPEGITTIYSSTFMNCSLLSRISLPSSVKVIGDYAFSGCAELDSLLMPAELRTIGESAFEGMKLQRNLLLPDKVLSIGGQAFKNWSSLESVHFGKGVMLIGDDAFAGDTMVTQLTSLAAVPPTVSETSLAAIPDSAWLAVLPEARTLYANDEQWGRFRMQVMPDSLYVPTKVTVDAEQTTALFTWPTDTAAVTYQIDIYKDGTKFCSLTLDSYGRLLGIAFAPGRNNKSGQSVESAGTNPQPYALSFMVTGLDEASRYNYVLSTLDTDGTPLHVYIGDFATTGYTGELNPDSGNEITPTPPIIPYDPESTSTAVEDAMESAIHGGSDPAKSAQLLIRSGELLIEHNGKIYTIQGQLKK